MILTTCVISQAVPQKVGLVLSGGGPRGVTHVGVLKALEEQNIPIDYIVGTSMGAIVGGLYSSGYSPDEIEKMMSSDELLSWITSSSDLQNQYFYSQPDPNAAWQIFSITYDSVLKARLPSNFIASYDTDFGLIKLFSGASAAANYNFDSLYIPFRCIASDIEESRAVAFKSGQLEKTIRASMTFPFYFKPIRIDGKLMFDGGMHNNFPIDVLTEDFNPDVILGVKAASNYGPPDEDDIISQVQSMLMANTRYTVDSTKGLLIKPKLWSVNITDFSNTKAFIDSGYVETIRQMPQIKSYIKSRETVEQKNIGRKVFRDKIPALYINDINTIGIRKDQQKYLDRVIHKERFLERLQSRNLSSEEQIEEIKQLYFKILSEKQVESVYPEIMHSDSGDYYTINFNISESNMLEAELGGLISSQAVNEIFLQLKLNYWRKQAFSLLGNMYLGRFHNSGHALARIDIPGRLPVALELGYTLNGWNYFNTSTYFFEDENPNFLIQKDNFWTFNASTPFSKVGKLNVGFQSGRTKDDYYQTNQFSRADTSDVTTFDFYSPGAVLEFNTLNRKQFATRGNKFRIYGSFISGLETNTPGSTSLDTTIFKKYHNWLMLRACYRGYFSLSKRVTLGFHAEGAISGKKLFHNYTSSVLSAPAFEPLPESKTIFQPQFRAHDYASLGMIFNFSIVKNLDLRAEGYMFQPFEEILKQEDNTAAFGDIFDKRYFIVSARVIYTAPFGPISFASIYYEDDNDPFIFNLSIGYFIFNKKPFQ